MDDIPPRSYGPLIETTLRVITWNVWGLHGPWPEREPAIVATLRDARPDFVVLTESWSKGGDSQYARLAGPLGLPHCAFSGVAAQEPLRAPAAPATQDTLPCWEPSPSAVLTPRTTTACKPTSAIERATSESGTAVLAASGIWFSLGRKAVTAPAAALRA